MKPVHGGNSAEMARTLNIPQEKLIDFSANINPLGPPLGWREHLQSHFDTLVHYPDSTYFSFRKSVADQYNLSPETIIPGNGAADLVWLYARTVRPRSVLLCTPTFSEYESAFLPWGTTIVHLATSPLTNFTPDLEQLSAALDEVDCFVLCNPNNPTGTVLDRTTMKTIVALTAEKGVKLFVDESFIQFVPHHYSLLHEPLPPHCFVLRSLTKIGAVPGLRVGFGVSSDQTFLVELANHGDSWPMNSLAAAFGSFLSNREQFLLSSCEEVIRLKEILVKSLFQTGVLAPFPSSTNFVLCQIVASLTAEQLCQRALESGIMIRNAASFRGLSNNYVRLAVRPEPEQAQLIDFLLNV